MWKARQTTKDHLMPGVVSEYNFDDWNMKMTQGGLKKKKKQQHQSQGPVWIKK